MYYLYIRKSNGFSANLAGEFDNLEDARQKAEEAKKADAGCSYTIEETNGCVNSYGEQITTVVKRG